MSYVYLIQYRSGFANSGISGEFHILMLSQDFRYFDISCKGDGILPILLIIIALSLPSSFDSISCFLSAYFILMIINIFVRFFTFSLIMIHMFLILLNSITHYFCTINGTYIVKYI